MKVVWSSQAKRDYYKVLDYLHDNWSIKELKSFINKTEEVLVIIQKQPQSFTESTRKKGIRKALITKHNSLFYKTKSKNKEIVLLAFWDNRQNPRKRNY